ncbi:hypothetical protein DSECCO2_607130 [anaerobic digester metagenome]
MSTGIESSRKIEKVANRPMQAAASDLVMTSPPKSRGISLSTASGDPNPLLAMRSREVTTDLRT